MTIRDAGNIQVGDVLDFGQVKLTCAARAEGFTGWAGVEADGTVWGECWPDWFLNCLMDGRFGPAERPEPNAQTIVRKRRKVSDKPAPKAPDIAQKPSRRPTKATAEIHHPTVKDSPPGEPISDFPPDRKPDAFVLGPKGETVHCWWVSDGKEARVDALIKGKPMGESKWRLIAEPFVLSDVVYGLYNWQRVEGADGAQKESVAPQAQ